MPPPAAVPYSDEMHAADVALFREQIGALRVQTVAHEEKDTAQFTEMRNRLTRIELALATALGGMLILGWLIDKSANNILHLLSNVK